MNVTKNSIKKIKQSVQLKTSTLRSVLNRNFLETNYNLSKSPIRNNIHNWLNFYGFNNFYIEKKRQKIQFKN
jgi:hypothetical protein